MKIDVFFPLDFFDKQLILSFRIALKRSSCRIIDAFIDENFEKTKLLTLKNIIYKLTNQMEDL